jgi:hypothetical protein
MPASSSVIKAIVDAVKYFFTVSPRIVQAAASSN